ncbi:hypothetical protein BDV93DRAFT_522478, partial [Ceratobasidium sp. AG-I]
MEEPVSQAWRNFQKLRSLRTDVNALDANSLSSLGQLPYLTAIVIQGTNQNHTGHSLERLPSSTSTTVLCKDSFPSLHYLTIHGLHYDDIMVIWRLAPL